MRRRVSRRWRQGVRRSLVRRPRLSRQLGGEGGVQPTSNAVATLQEECSRLSARVGEIVEECAAKLAADGILVTEFTSTVKARCTWPRIPALPSAADGTEAAARLG
ncbi:unnamed protein product [Prorocentrum cordatum]|uniref:Uncharacterized protein n=1 Tax=Prorocentrum cordatum TaxID=2364126 RepID=A0ABN9Y203_9DINO|nr:unnamed protein product [Polarella glacialis]